jgi:RHS repeat-associated protein
VIQTDSLTPYSSTLTDKLVTGHLTGQKQYEVTDHLGDVLATVSDSRSPNTTVTPATIAYYTPVLQSEYDYYPFGMLMPGRYTSDTTLHCTTLSEEKLIPTPVSTWVSWVLGGGSPLSPIGGGTLTSPGSGVLISTSAAGDGALYDLSSLTLGMPYELDLMVDSASIGYQAQIIQDDTLVLATVDINPGGSAMRPVHFTASSSTLGLQVVAGTATTGYVGIGGHYMLDTVMVAKLVVTTECSDGSYPYGYNGKMKDNEWAGVGNHLDYGFRMLDTRIGRFISVDPLTKKYPWWTPYQFASNTPLWGTDLDGREVRIFTETKQLGHAFLTVGKGKDVTVYTYGRYAGVDNHSGVTSGRFSPTGPGVLVKMTGDKATNYIAKELNQNQAQGFEITDANQKLTTQHMDAMWQSSDKIPDVGLYKGDANAHVIDKYSLSGSNCVTKSTEGVKAGGSSQSFQTSTEGFLGPDIGTKTINSDVISPSGLQDYLSGQSKNNGSGVKNVTEQAKKESAAPASAPQAPAAAPPAAPAPSSSGG